MARKTTTKTDSATGDTPLSSDDRKHALRAITAITGCGRRDAERRLGNLTLAKQHQIATLERDGRRRQVCAILYS
jgi:hypothetical protein